MDKNIKCSLCEKTILESTKIIMVNKINKKVLEVCKECFNEFFNKSESDN